MDVFCIVFLSLLIFVVPLHSQNRDNINAELVLKGCAKVVGTPTKRKDKKHLLSHHGKAQKNPSTIREDRQREL